MQQPEFEKALQEQIKRSEDMLFSKNDHYNPGTDKLSSFKRAAALREVTPQEALSGMMVKHTTSVYDLCNKPVITNTPLEVWNEKITDHINYLLLLRALVEEKFAAEQGQLMNIVMENVASQPTAEIYRQQVEQLANVGTLSQ